MAAVLAGYSACTFEQWRHGMYILIPEVKMSEEREAGIPRIGERVY